jgi:hypothetical protein
MRLVHTSEAVASLERDLRRIFGDRMHSFVVYGSGAHGSEPSAEHGSSALTHTLAVIDALSTDDLRSCAARIDAWHDRGLATPLLVAAHEFGRSLDVFPYEFGAILADYTLVAGTNLFDGLTVDTADLRRACEVEARGHLLHLREAFLETRGRGDALALMIVESAPAFAALLINVARLDAQAPKDAAAAARHVERRLELASPIASKIAALTQVSEISSAEAERLFGAYLDATDRLVRYVDAWK